MSHDKYQRCNLDQRYKEIAEYLGLTDVSDFFSKGDNDLIYVARMLVEAGYEKAREFLTRAHGRDWDEEESYFPHGEELGEYLYELLLADWCRPRKRYEKGELRSVVEPIAHWFNISGDLILTDDPEYAIEADRRAIKKARDDFFKEASEAMRTAYMIAADFVWGVGRGKVRDSLVYAYREKNQGIVPLDYLDEAAQKIKNHISLDAGAGAALTVGPEMELGREYPFDKIVGLQQQGLYFAGFGPEGAIVWHPPGIAPYMEGFELYVDEQPLFQIDVAFYEF